MFKTKWDAAKIKHLRKACRMSQAEFARLLGARQQTISEWETSMYTPKNAYAMLLSMVEERQQKGELCTQK